MCFGGFRPAKNVEVPPTPVGGAPPCPGNQPDRQEYPYIAGPAYNLLRITDIYGCHDITN